MSRHLCGLLLLAALLLVACEPVAAPSPAEPTRTPAIPTNTPVLVAFPTSLPTAPLATPPATLPTPTLVAFSTTAPSPVATTPSAPATTTRAATPPPLVQLVSPIASTQISVNQTFYVVVYAAADSGVSRIELTDDGAAVRSDTAPAPPIFSSIIPWTPTQIGPHTLRAIAYDANNRPSKPDEVTVTVIQDARRPTSIIVYPIGQPQVEMGSVLQLYGVATDEVGVTQVDLWVDNQEYTYLTAQNSLGQPAFPFVFSWNAQSAGAHTFLVRAHDNQDQTNDSAPLKILVVDNQPPSLNVMFDRTNALASESITITVTALDASGIQRLELVSGKDLVSTITSPSPTRQTLVSTQFVWQSPNPGDYSIVVRAVNANGNVTESPAQIVSILRAGQATPTPALTNTPTRTRVRPTTTPRSEPPPPPKAEITSPTDRFSTSAPLRVSFTGQGNAELDRIELWGYLPGQPNPQIVCVIDARATTQKAGQCDWSPPTAGVVTLYAQAVDIYRQSSRSPQISGYLGAPILPTATPTPLLFTGRWSAVTSTGPMTVTLRQTGTTLRGEFKMAGVEATGRITSGTLKGDRVTFSVDFAPATTPTATAVAPLTPTTETPTVSATASALSLDFDCLTDLNAGTMSCSFRDSRGRTGAAFFRRETTP